MLISNGKGVSLGKIKKSATPNAITSKRRKIMILKLHINLLHLQGELL
jgi:hypothetical protein